MIMEMQVQKTFPCIHHGSLMKHIPRNINACIYKMWMSTLMLRHTFCSAKLSVKTTYWWLLNLLRTIFCPGINCEEQRSSCLIKSQQPYLKEESSNPPFGLAVPYTSQDEANGQIGVSGTHLRPNSQPPLAKQYPSNLHSGLDSSGETQIRNGRPRSDGRGRNQFFSRYCPRFTDQDLQQISGEYPLILLGILDNL